MASWQLSTAACKRIDARVATYSMPNLREIRAAVREENPGSMYSALSQYAVHLRDANPQVLLALTEGLLSENHSQRSALEDLTSGLRRALDLTADDTCEPLR